MVRQDFAELYERFDCQLDLASLYKSRDTEAIVYDGENGIDGFLVAIREDFLVEVMIVRAHSEKAMISMTGRLESLSGSESTIEFHIPESELETCALVSSLGYKCVYEYTAEDEIFYIMRKGWRFELAPMTKYRWSGCN